MSTRTRLAAGYFAVFSLMVGWWSGLQAAASIGWALLVLVAYGVLLIGWALVVSTAGPSHQRAEAR